MEFSDALTKKANAIIAQYPESRSALLPLLHLVQSEEGYVSSDGIAFCAELLDLTTAEVSAVSTFYTMYKRHKTGKHHVGVCINTMCGLLGGDQIWSALSDELDAGHDETTKDGMFTLERIECQAACTHAPVVTFDWEFFDDATVESVLDAVSSLKAGKKIKSTRGATPRGLAHTEKVLAGIDEKDADEPVIDEKMLAGLKQAKKRGHMLPKGEV